MVNDNDEVLPMFGKNIGTESSHDNKGSIIGKINDSDLHGSRLSANLNNQLKNTTIKLS